MGLLLIAGQHYASARVVCSTSWCGGSTAAHKLTMIPSEAALKQHRSMGPYGAYFSYVAQIVLAKLYQLWYHSRRDVRHPAQVCS